jgi:hypothetical protein
MQNLLIRKNTFLGYAAGTTTTTGIQNTALGYAALQSLTTGNNNVAIGVNSLSVATSSSSNVGVGHSTLAATTSGANNTALGGAVLRLNTTGGQNTGVGTAVMFNSTTASHNAMLGWQVGWGITDGTGNIGVGSRTLFNLTEGDYNTALGYQAGDNITTGSRNIIIGADINATSATGDDQLNIGNTIYGNLASGNVGIGQTTPTAVLHLKAGTATANTAPLKFTSGALNTVAEAGAVEFLNDSYYGTITTGAERKTFAFLESPTFTTQITSPLILGGTSTTQDLTFQTTSGVGETGADMHFLVGNNGATEAMTILNNGNVGIGVEVPLSTLHIESGDLRVQSGDILLGASTARIGRAGGINSESIEFGDSLNIQYDTRASHIFSTDAAERFKIQDSALGGNVIISNASLGIGVDPTYALDVLATGTGIIARFQSDNATGCTLADGGTITCTSDERMKKNIEDITYGLDTLRGLRPVLFNWNYEDDTTSKNLGFIAQEVEALVPKLIATDENGMKSLNTVAMVPILTKAIQEMDLQITDIQNFEKENTWRDSIIAWFANAENRIGDFFANRVRTKELCIENDLGETCVTRDQLDALLYGASVSPAPAVVTTEEEEETPVVEEPVEETPEEALVEEEVVEEIVEEEIVEEALVEEVIEEPVVEEETVVES